jgi:hypothetical protein
MLWAQHPGEKNNFAQARNSPPPGCLAVCRVSA